LFDAELCFDPLRDSKVGYTVISSALHKSHESFGVKIYSKKEIWEELVIPNLGTENGKIKIVIATE